MICHALLLAWYPANYQVSVSRIQLYSRKVALVQSRLRTQFVRTPPLPFVSLPGHKSTEGPGQVVEQYSPHPYRPLCGQFTELVYAPLVVVHTPGGRRPGAERASRGFWNAGSCDVHLRGISLPI